MNYSIKLEKYCAILSTTNCCISESIRSSNYKVPVWYL